MIQKITAASFLIFTISALIVSPLFGSKAKIIEKTRTIGGVPIRIQIPATSVREEKAARIAIDKAFKIAVSLGVKDASVGSLIDKEALALKDCGIKNAFVNSDMEMYCLGMKSGKDMWKAWIPHPTDSGKVFAILRLKNDAIATVRNNTMSASVVADTAGDAERLARELLFQGPEGLKTAEQLGLDALLIMQDGKGFKTGMSGGFKEQYGKAKK
jgi:hypothetical protein